MTIYFFKILGMNARLSKIFECFNTLSRSSKRHRVTLSKISKIFLRRILNLKILKKFMVIFHKNIHFYEFFQDFWSKFPLSNLKIMFFLFYFFSSAHQLQCFNTLSRPSKRHRVTLSKTSKILLRRILNLKIQKKMHGHFS